MGNVFRFPGRRYGHGRSAAQVLGAFLLGACIALAATHHDRWSSPTLAAADAIVQQLFRQAPAIENPIAAVAARTSDYAVVDGDTLRTNGRTYRLVGIDTPETGSNARCAGEAAQGRAATERLGQLVSSTDTELREVPCACRPGTEGTDRCNYGRRCASLSVNGRDVGAILIEEGLARPYHCSATACPRRQSWCG
jgi:endonuclease YncB( thermonuclease family)